MRPVRNSWSLQKITEARPMLLNLLLLMHHNASLLKCIEAFQHPSVSGTIAIAGVFL